MKSIFIYLLSLTLLSACSTPIAKDIYQTDLQHWRTDRLAYLTRPDGWTTLVGLYWLSDSLETYGAAPDNDIVFPKSAPANIGQFALKNEKVVATILPDIPVFLDGAAVTQPQVIHTDIEEGTNYFTYQSLQWHIIKRGTKYAIRLKDTLNPARFSLTSLPHFPVSKKWVVDTRFQPAAQGDTLKVLNAVGITSALHPAGKLFFEIDGQTYSFVALDGGPDELFVVMGDETTGVETYGGGRFLDIPRADSTGHTIIDFNKAYNPPCVYSEYATCPLPTRENTLPIAIKAGELMEEGHEHE